MVTLTVGIGASSLVEIWGCRLRGIGEFFPPAEEQAKEAYGYGYAVSPDAEEDLPLGYALEGTGFLVHGGWSWLVLGGAGIPEGWRPAGIRC